MSCVFHHGNAKQSLCKGIPFILVLSVIFVQKKKTAVIQKQHRDVLRVLERQVLIL